jgi:hypothetical protein
MTSAERQAHEDEQQAEYLRQWSERHKDDGGRCSLVSVALAVWLAYMVGRVLIACYA